MVTAVQEGKRLDFCRRAREGNIDWSEDVIISDESRFGLFDDRQGTLNAERYQQMLRDNSVIEDIVAHFGER
jgi:hypothetical protein